jgi:hypothetical protein
VISNPGLDPTGLQNNGGPTQTIAIVDGSSYAAFGGLDGIGGVTLFTDQRGYAPAPGNWSIGAYQFNGAPAAAPTATLISAPNVSPQDYGKTSYTFEVEFFAQAGIYPSALDAPVVTVAGPGYVSPVQAVDVINPEGPANPSGAYQEYIAIYTITPPGGAWTSAANGTYTISLESTVYDTLGNSVGPETLGTFLVETANIGITKFALTRAHQANFWTGLIKLTNNGSSAFTGPLFVVFNLPAGAVLENATGTYNGMPYLEITPGSLAAGASVSATVAFNENIAPGAYSTTYYIGSLGS